MKFNPNPNGEVTAQFSMAEYVDRVRSDLAQIRAHALPDFFVLSPPRTGTTWLANVLASHPDVYIPPEKELRYFDVGWRTSVIDYYLSRYFHAGTRLKGDASPSYVLLPESVIQLLHQAKPAMKFIVILRDMGQRAWSNFCHSCSIGEFGLHSGITFQDQVPDEKVINYLINDYSTSVGDYKEYLSRWLRYFPATQFFIIKMDEIGSPSELMLSKLYGFLNISKERQESGGIKAKINAGMWFPRSDRVDQILKVLYGARHRCQVAFFKERFEIDVQYLFESPHEFGEPLPLFNRGDGFKVFIWDGCFNACQVEDFWTVSKSLHNSSRIDIPFFVAKHYSELEGQIDAHKKRQNASRSEQDRGNARLVSILNDMALDYDASNTLRVNLEGTRLIREFEGFNLVSSLGLIIGFRQTLGHIDPTATDPQSLVKLFGPNNVIVGHSVEEVMRSIVHLESCVGTELIVEGHCGFNIVRHNAQWCGIAQAVGAIDLNSLDEAVLDDLKTNGSFVTGESLTDVKVEILRLVMQRSAGQSGVKIEDLDLLKNQTEQNHLTLQEKVRWIKNEIEQRNRSLQEDVGRLQQQFDRLLGSPLVKFVFWLGNLFKRRWF